ncbi:unnamed protein product [Paramecium sonneborni]|uniref:WD40-repeat-containing domain n=1 Tax=Paramecium sonneborni TaxID=65129 RepID=A0A8S1RKF9_9CILI|nr:unnamed protein product [Paramecium sonneborni]
MNFNNESALQLIGQCLLLLEQILQQYRKQYLVGNQKSYKEQQEEQQLSESNDRYDDRLNENETVKSGDEIYQFDFYESQNNLPEIVIALKSNFQKLKEALQRVKSQIDDQSSQNNSSLSNSNKIMKKNFQFAQDQKILKIIEGQHINQDLQQYFCDKFKNDAPQKIKQQKMDDNLNRLITYTSSNFCNQIEGIYKVVNNYLYSVRPTYQDDYFSQQSLKLRQDYEKDLKQFIMNIKDFSYQFGNIYPIEIQSYKSKLQQIKKSQALCFNLDDSLLATTENEIIHIWQFQEGQMIEFNKPKSQHKNDVACILFSQKYKYSFFSAGGLGDYSIFMWYFSNNNWECIEAQNYKTKNNGGFRSMILNKNEDKLFTSDSFGNIRIWKVDQINKVFIFENELKEFTKQCWSISLNESETQLVAFGEDKQIIVWEKQQNNEWKLLNKITQQDQACRGKFLNDSTFVFCTHNEGKLIEMKIEGKNKEKVVEITNMQLDFKKSDLFSFPIQYINNKQILIVKHNRYIYFQKRDNLGKMKMLTYLRFQNKQLFGTLSNDKQYQVVWNDGYYYVYKLNL